MWEGVAMAEKDTYWETSWQKQDKELLISLLARYEKWNGEELQIFKKHGLKRICDAACGFGAYSVAYASNGFDVYSFDISETAAEVTRSGLQHYELNSENVKTASILDTGYANDFFDGVIAHSVLDHMTVKDAERGLLELYRITRSGGLILVSFDAVEEDDYNSEHSILDDGSIRYQGTSSRSGMVLHPYNWDKIDQLTKGLTVLYKKINEKQEQVVILQKA